MSEEIVTTPLTMKGVEVKVRELVDLLEKEVDGIQLAVVIAIPEVNSEYLACSAYINMDLGVLVSTIQRQMRSGLDNPLQIT